MLTSVAFMFTYVRQRAACDASVQDRNQVTLEFDIGHIF